MQIVDSKLYGPAGNGRGEENPDAPPGNAMAVEPSTAPPANVV
eukprot:COSAG04_NODE_5536_length_1580_cov_0.974342_3_plen_43_part_00